MGAMFKKVHKLLAIFSPFFLMQVAIPTALAMASVSMSSEDVYFCSVAEALAQTDTETTVQSAVRKQLSTSDGKHNVTTFAMPYDGHGRLRASLDTSRDDFSGIALGGKFIHATEIGNLCYLVAFDYGKQNLHCSGIHFCCGSSARRDHCGGVLAMGYEIYGKNKPTIDVFISAAGSRGYNTLHRPLNGEFDQVSAKFCDTQISGAGEAFAGIFSFSGIKIGPWIGASYDRIRQSAYDERASIGDGSEDPAISMSAINYNFAYGVLGFGFKKEMHVKNSDEENGNMYGKIGWKYNFYDRFSGGTALNAGAECDFSANKIDSGRSEALLMSVGFLVRPNDRVELRGQLDCILRHDRFRTMANISMGLQF
jgi:hypothetical protein